MIQKTSVAIGTSNAIYFFKFHFGFLLINSLFNKLFGHTNVTLITLQLNNFDRKEAVVPQHALTLLQFKKIIMN